MIKPLLLFKDFPENSSTPNDLLKLLDKISSDDLKRFLIFSTEQPNIPITGFQNPNIQSAYPRDKLIILRFDKSEKLPESHVCYYRIDLPDYNNYEILEKKILQAIQNSRTFEFA